MHICNAGKEADPHLFVTATEFNLAERSKASLRLIKTEEGRRKGNLTRLLVSHESFVWIWLTYYCNSNSRHTSDIKVM